MKKLITTLLILLSCFHAFSQDSTAIAQPAQGYDKAPQYPGGEQKMFQFIITNFKYPASAIRDGVGGNVLTQFLVNTDGSLSNLKIVKGVRKDLNDEALRLVRLMGKWEPGSLQGTPVAVTYNLPFNFGTPPKPQQTPQKAGNQPAKLPAKGWNFPVQQPAKKKG